MTGVCSVVTDLQAAPGGLLSRLFYTNTRCCLVDGDVHVCGGARDDAGHTLVEVVSTTAGSVNDTLSLGRRVGSVNGVIHVPGHDSHVPGNVIVVGSDATVTYSVAAPHEVIHLNRYKAPNER